MSTDWIDELRVVDLKEELKKRDLAISGKKAELAARLLEAVEKEVDVHAYHASLYRIAKSSLVLQLKFYLLTFSTEQLLRNAHIVRGGQSQIVPGHSCKSCWDQVLPAQQRTLRLQGSKGGKKAQAAEATPEEQPPAKEPEEDAPSVADAATEKPADAAEVTEVGGGGAGGAQEDQTGDAASPAALEDKAPAEALLLAEQDGSDKAPVNTPSLPGAQEVMEEAQPPEIGDEPEEPQAATPGTLLFTLTDTSSLFGLLI